MMRRNQPNDIPAEARAGTVFQVGADQVDICAGPFHVNRLIAASILPGHALLGALDKRRTSDWTSEDLVPKSRDTHEPPRNAPPLFSPPLPRRPLAGKDCGTGDAGKLVRVKVRLGQDVSIRGSRS